MLFLLLTVNLLSQPTAKLYLEKAYVNKESGNSMHFSVKIGWVQISLSTILY